MRWAGHRVVLIGVVGIGDPESGRCGILVKQARACSNKNGQVIGEDVADFNAILHEVSTAQNIVDEVSCYCHIVSRVNVNSSIEGLVNGTLSHIGARRIAQHVEVNCVAAEAKGLADMGELNIGEA